MSSTRTSRAIFALLLIGQARGTVVITNDIPTPVARYTFNNNAGAGTDVTADIGTNCTITATWGEDPVDSDNFYLVFNGTTSLATCGTDNDNYTDLTAFAFVQFTNFGESGTGIVVMKGQAASTNFSWRATITDAGSGVDRSQSTTQNTSALNDGFASDNGTLTAFENTGQWVGLSWSLYDFASMDTKAFLGINGLRVTTTQVASNGGTVRDDAAFELHIGSAANGSNTFNGLIDDVEIYSPHIDQFQLEYRYNRGRLPLVPEAPDELAINETDCETDFADVLALADRFDEHPLAIWGDGGDGCNIWPGNERE